MKDLKEKTLRAGLARLCAQGADFSLRLVSLMVIARLLEPKDFGLVGMATAFTGVLALFRDFGLSAATVQRTTVTDEQVSTLFWINLLVGIMLAVLAVAMAPALAAFYREPRVFNVTVALGAAFVFNGAGIQHGALLQRELRFTAAAVINVTALLVGTMLAIGAALAGYRYWSLVAMATALPLVSTIGCWLATGWIPGMPRKNVGLRSMMRFGGTLTLSGLLVYISTNFEKVLLGRFWGVEALGVYGRAYQLIRIPTDNLNFAAGEVAFSALSRVQTEPDRLKKYFLKGYSLVLTMTMPITLLCAFFAQDIIRVFLGAKWSGAVPIFQLLAPTMLVFAIVNPLGWLLSALGMVGRSLKMSLAITPFMIAAYIIGLPHGPKGVALAYSSVTVIWLMPAIAWSVHGTVFSIGDILATVSRPLVSSMIAGAIAFGIESAYLQLLSPLPRLVLETVLFTVLFLFIMIFCTGQKSFYLNLFKSLRGTPSEDKNWVGSADEVAVLAADGLASEYSRTRGPD